MVNTSLRCIKPKPTLRTRLSLINGPQFTQDRTPVCGTEVGVPIPVPPQIDKYQFIIIKYIKATEATMRTQP